MSEAYLVVQALTCQSEPVNMLLWFILGVATAGIVMLKPAPPPMSIVDVEKWFAQYIIDSGWEEVKRKIAEDK